jgi:hypothetical protein
MVDLQREGFDMSLVPVHIVLDITFNLAKPAESTIRTNAKPEVVEELIANWLRDQMGRGKDNAQPVLKSEYKIKIGLDLSDDTFYTESDTGNKSLTCGLVMCLLKHLDKVAILPLP